jgi:hypothetical protein
VRVTEWRFAPGEETGGIGTRLSSRRWRAWAPILFAPHNVMRYTLS